MGKPTVGDKAMVTGNEGVGLRGMSPIDFGSNVAARLNKPKGLDRRQPLGDGVNQLVSSKAAVKVRDKVQTLSKTRDESGPICGAMYQRRSQPIIKEKWSVKEGEVTASSKASERDAYPTVPWQEAASIVVVEEVDVGVMATVQMSTKEVAKAFGSFTNKTKGFIDVSREGVDAGVPASLAIDQMITEEAAGMSGSYTDKTEGIFNASGE